LYLYVNLNTPDIVCIFIWTCIVCNPMYLFNVEKYGKNN